MKSLYNKIFLSGICLTVIIFASESFADCESFKKTVETHTLKVVEASTSQLDEILKTHIDEATKERIVAYNNKKSTGVILSTSELAELQVLSDQIEAAYGLDKRPSIRVSLPEGPDLPAITIRFKVKIVKDKLSQDLEDALGGSYVYLTYDGTSSYDLLIYDEDFEGSNLLEDFLTRKKDDCISSQPMVEPSPVGTEVSEQSRNIPKENTPEEVQQLKDQATSGK